MTTSPRQVAGRILYRRILLLLALLAAFPRTMFAPVLYQFNDITVGETSDHQLLTIDLSYYGFINWKNTVESSADLLQWDIIDVVTPVNTDAISLEYFLPLSTTRTFFRLGLQTQIN